MISCRAATFFTGFATEVLKVDRPTRAAGCFSHLRMPARRTPDGRLLPAAWLLRTRFVSTIDHPGPGARADVTAKSPDLPNPDKLTGVPEDALALYRAGDETRGAHRLNDLEAMIFEG
jgi:hypothetical protein